MRAELRKPVVSEYHTVADARRLYRCLISLPIYPQMADEYGKKLHHRGWVDVLPRVLVDLAVVHSAFLLSLLFLAWKQAERGGSQSSISIETLRRLYVLGFLPLSFLVVVFLVLANAGVLGSRWLKHWLVARELGAASGEPARPAGDKPVLVVGGAGYVGSVLCRKLLSAGRKVRVLDCLIYGDGAIRELLRDPRFELQVGDVRNIQAVVAAAQGVDAIVHLAAIVGDPACEQDRQSALEINYAATPILLEVAQRSGVERLVFASSCSIYGAAEQVVDERSQLAPISLYAETKVESERALLEARSQRFHPVILRFATVFGPSPRPRFDLVVNLLTAKAHREGKITIYNGEQWRPFLHVEDVARGILCVLRAPLQLVSGEIFNLGDNRLNCTLREVAEQIREAFPASQIEWVENGDRRNYRVSFDRIRQRLGFEAGWTLQAGIEQMKRSLQSGQALDHGSAIYHNQKHLKQLGTIHKEEVDARVMAAFAQALLREEASPSLSR